MSMPALSRLLKAIAKSIKHAAAMSTIFGTEIFQARHDAVLATSKLLLENSSYELRNAPINSKTLFDNKLPRAILRPSSKYSLQLFRLLLTYSNNKKWLIQLLQSLRDLTSQLNLPGLSKRSLTSLKVRHSHTHPVKKTMLRKVEIRNSSPPLSQPPLSTTSPTTSRHSSGRNVGPFCGTMGRTNRQTTCGFSLSSETDSRSHSSLFLIPVLPVTTRRDHRTSKKTAMERYRIRELPAFIPGYF